MLFFVWESNFTTSFSKSAQTSERKEICTGFGIPSDQIQVFLMVKSIEIPYVCWDHVDLHVSHPIRSMSKISHLWFERCPCFCDLRFLTCQLHVGPGVATFTRLRCALVMGLASPENVTIFVVPQTREIHRVDPP